VVFLDNGGVISDHALLPVEVRRLIGEFFADRLGGDRGAWEEANREIFEPTWREFMGSRHETARRFAAFEAAQREYAVAWLQRMSERVGVQLPAAREALRLEREAFEFIWPRAEVALPGAPEAVRTIMEAGFALHMASSGVSWELEALMAGLGIGSCFATYSGIDLAGWTKNGPEYYEGVFGHAGVAPQDALVVDDRPEAVGWARELGARTVLITGEAAPGEAGIMAASLAELAGQLAEL